MSMIINPDDFKVGMHITVHSHTEAERTRRLVRSGVEGTNSEELLIRVESHEDSGFRIQLGIPLKVIAIELPFLYCMVVEPGNEHSGPVVLDSRNLRFMRVTAPTLRALAKVRV